ncbi:DUF4157 domain-containing protein [Kribbella sp. C-35]|uniref:eCIS core domain-containing protein n=1 Tax=Kribbella sp. C-35 TaxID=2789276 RepID=UPI003978F47D
MNRSMSRVVAGRARSAGTPVPHGRAVPSGAVPAVWNLQRIVGNQVAGELLADGADAAHLDLSSRGQVLDPVVAAVIGSRLGKNVDHVRVHIGSEAVQLAERLHARAFAVGQDVYFNAGEYRPGTAGGQALLAHELSHTVQARGRRIMEEALLLPVGRNDSRAELSARRAADAGTAGRQPPALAEVAPALHRQAKAGAPARIPTVVVFGSGPGDTAGARRLAAALAGRIQAGTMTDDDHEVLRQAGSYFTVPARDAFHAVIDSAIKDRDVLREVRRNAPAQAPGVGVIPPLLVTTMRANSVADAERVGGRHAVQLRTGTVSVDLRDEIEATIRFFEGRAKTVYRAKVAQAVEGVRARTERHQRGERKLLDNRGHTLGPSFGPTSRVEEFQTEILPTGPARKTFSMAFALIAATRQQTSDSVSVELYTDYSAGAEVGVKIPIKKIVEIKLGAGVKKGRKSADRHEEAKVRVDERRASRSYQLDVLEREVVRKTFREVTDETRPTGGGFVMAESVETALQSGDTETQLGYGLTSKDSGESRTVWPVFTGRRISRTAGEGLAALLDADGDRMAAELARLDQGF